MPRLMSVAYTENAVRARSKTVTRRAGWSYLQAGQQLTLCRKVMGRRKGEPLVRLAAVQVSSVRRESLALLTQGGEYANAEMVAEGFPGLPGHEFVRRYFTDAQGIPPDATVTRVEWTYLDTVCLRCGHEATPGWRQSEEWEASRYCATCLLGPIPEQRAAGLIR